MPFETFDLEQITRERRESIAKTIRVASVDELKKLCEQIFPYIDDPWREAFLAFVAENRHATFHHAITSDGVHVLYCREKDKGMWFKPGVGKGPLQERGCKTMEQVIERSRSVD
jgi:hypothetical protein